MTEPTMNQYAPPQAQVADAPLSGGVAEMKLFSAKGRIGRLRYLAYGAGASFLYYFALSVLPFALLGLGTALLYVSLVSTLAALLWFNVITGIKRCHDMNISGWWSLTLIVPVIVLAWMFVPGDRGENRFGPPPPPNTLGIRLLALLIPLVFFVGVLAAITIPAYKHYTDRARAAQVAGPQ
jgi:uncharacterized membrane protein YhaH (DUF805 family)